MYLLYLRWPDSFRELLAICDSKEKAEEFKTETLEQNSILEDYIRVIEVEPNTLYKWHEMEKVW